MIVIGPIIAIIRLLLFALVTFTVFSFLLLTNFLYKSKATKMKRGILYRRFIIRTLHYLFGSKITVYGEEPTTSGLIVSNHRSYFDSLVILSNILAYPIAKKEVASWPIVGKVCKDTGVIFVDRENKSNRKAIRNRVNQVLKDGFSIVNTPEGTTHIEPTTIDFKPGAFIIAAKLNKPVIPIAIDYKDLNDAWIGDDTFVPHFIRCFGKWRTEIKVSYLKPILSDDADELISLSKKQIDDELIRFRKEWNLKL